MKPAPLKKIILSALFLSLAYLLPFFIGNIPRIGKALCPMHIPIFLCGFICGPSAGLIIGFTAPILRSLTVGQPLFFPMGISMAFELSTYGLLSGLLYRILPKKKISILISLISAMIAGRLVWGTARLICVGLDTTKFNFTIFWIDSVVTAIPGIIVQITVVPALIILCEKVAQRTTTQIL